MIKLITRKQPKIILKKKELLESEHWLLMRNVYRMEHYTVFCDCREHVFVNPEVDDCEKVVEALQKIFACRLLDETVEKLLDELKVLTGQETSKAVLMMWLEWRNAVKNLELNEQACVVLKTARSKRLYCKSRKQREIIKELFDIGFGLYEPGTKCDFQRGAENAFMYGYLMGMKADGVTAVKGGAA